MGLPALVLAQALVSLAPSYYNLRSLPADLTADPVVELPGPSLTPGDWQWNRSLSPPEAGPQQAVQLSDGYYTRLDIHRYASYATLPLFLLEYVAGQKLLERGSAAPLWAEKVHKPAAYAVAGIFTVNTVTGIWNLAEAGNKKVKQGKNRRWWHAALMLAADAGFIYSASRAPSTSDIDARIAGGTRGGWTPHKATAVASMGVATIGYLMMYVWKVEGEE